METFDLTYDNICNDIGEQIKKVNSNINFFKTKENERKRVAASSVLNLLTRFEFSKGVPPHSVVFIFGPKNDDKKILFNRLTRATNSQIIFNDVSNEKETLQQVKSQFPESILLCVCPLTSGTIELTELQELLKIYKTLNFTQKIVFVLTKVASFIESNRIIEDYTNEGNNDEDKLLHEVNKIVKEKFIKFINKEYPQSRITIFETSGHEFFIDYSLNITRSPVSNCVSSRSIDQIQTLITSIDNINHELYLKFFKDFYTSEVNSTIEELSKIILEDELPLQKVALEVIINQKKEKCKTNVLMYLNSSFDNYIQDTFNELSLIDRNVRINYSKKKQKEIIEKLENELKFHVNEKILSTMKDISETITKSLPQTYQPKFTVTEHTPLMLITATGGIWVVVGLAFFGSMSLTLCVPLALVAAITACGTLIADNDAFRKELKKQFEKIQDDTIDYVDKIIGGLINPANEYLENCVKKKLSVDINFTII